MKPEKKHVCKNKIMVKCFGDFFISWLPYKITENNLITPFPNQMRMRLSIHLYLCYFFMFVGP